MPQRSVSSNRHPQMTPGNLWYGIETMLNFRNTKFKIAWYKGCSALTTIYSITIEDVQTRMSLCTVSHSHNTLKTIFSCCVGKIWILNVFHFENLWDSRFWRVCEDWKLEGMIFWADCQQNNTQIRDYWIITIHTISC